jgi:hypothetical protein
MVRVLEGMAVRAPGSGFEGVHAQARGPRGAFAQAAAADW